MALECLISYDLMTKNQVCSLSYKQNALLLTGIKNIVKKS